MPKFSLLLSHDLTIAPNRQRVKFDPDAIGDLANSIRKIGLLHPIVVRRTDTGHILVSGERRMKAIETLTLLGESYRFANAEITRGHLVCVDIGELSPLEAEEAELEENIMRVDLSWQEREAAIANLHRLRQLQNPEHRIADTAREVFKEEQPSTARTQVAEALRLTEAVKANPEIAKAKTKSEAIKILKKQDAAERYKALGKEMDKVPVESMHRLLLGECHDTLQGMPSAQFDVILTDPPYGMGADEFGDAAGRMAGTGHSYDDSRKHFQELMVKLIERLWYTAKPQAHLYLWCDLDQFHFLRDLCVEHGWWTFRTPLINVKPEGGRVPWPENGPRRCYETCLFAVKGKKPVNYIAPDVFESRLTEGNFGHGAQKPVEAYVNLLKRSCQPGDSVLDCFAGTGTIFPAAHALQLKATGIEMDETSYGIALSRMRELK